MDQYDFTYEFPNDFENRTIQILQQDHSGKQMVDSFKRCRYEYEDVGLAYYAGLRNGDYWNKHALDFTIEGHEKDISILKLHNSRLKEAFTKALRGNISGFAVRKIFFLIDEASQFSETNEDRLNADIITAESVLNDLIQIGGRLCSNATYRKGNTENSINDFFRDSLSFLGYVEIKDQTRHGISASGQDAGEVDFLITKENKEIAIMEGLKLDSVNTSYIDEHIHKAIINYNALGTATFIMAYVSTTDYEGFWRKYFSHLQTKEYELTIKKDIRELAHPNASTRVAQIILSRDGYDFPVYFIAFKLLS